eukprot:CAMPEP_0168626064 /NCGR_PEP_ID=MMETSP0449_2-20121227/10406_1 /TAXON_ID=1082188 /ORGANISM="Strombidium rassoulzadegani, Strain ras09" /LENGTH=98 /DNA_ID=CAMNT_0008667981 /DNA_START=680 /DNA_END=976 /DNA_ORIENTATION=+
MVEEGDEPLGVLIGAGTDVLAVLVDQTLILRLIKPNKLLGLVEAFKHIFIQSLLLAELFLHSIPKVDFTLSVVVAMVLNRILERAGGGDFVDTELEEP